MTVQGAFHRLLPLLPRKVQAAAGGLYLSASRRTWCRVEDAGTYFLHRYTDGAVASRAAVGPSPADAMAITEDLFFYTYRPVAGDVVVDVGAGVGGETLVLSRLVGPTGCVIAVEAHPVTFRCLEATASANRLTNVRLVAGAAANDRTPLRMSDDVSGWQGNSVTGGGEGIVVEGFRLDDVLADHEVVHYVKMNIEGAEVEALDGLSSIASRVRHCAISCHDFKADKSGNEFFRTSHRVEEWMRSHGFGVTRRTDERPFVADIVYGDRRA